MSSEDTTPGRGQLRGALTQGLVIVTVFATVGAVCGLLWFWWWEPAQGVVNGSQWFTDERGLRGDFNGTGLYVAIALVAGAVTGVVTTFLLDRAELVTLAAVLLGSALAGWLMLQVGQALGPADPEALALTAEDGTRLPDDLGITGRIPLVSFPGAALSALVMVFVLFPRARDNER